MMPTNASTRRHQARGFTLVELVIALTAGLMVSAAAFVLARQATTFFRGETSISSAQFSSMLGLTRLTSDLRRAGFMSSPNAANDPRRCGDMSGWPDGLNELTSLQIVEGGSLAQSDHTLTQANGLNPDAIVIGGMPIGTEHFAVQAMYAGGGGWTIVLQNDGAMVRTLLTAADPATALDGIFVAGRFLRLVDPEGREAYGLITGVGFNAPNFFVTVDSVPDMPTHDTSGVCGCKLPCVGSLVNPVARVRYDLRTIDPATWPQYTGLYSTVTHGEAAKHKGMAAPVRTELVRVELDADDQEIPGTLEVIAEYAVDLKFGITTAVPGALGQPPTVLRLPIGDPAVYTTAATNAGGGTPQHIRAVQVRLTTRVARGDRDVEIPGPDPVKVGGTADPAIDGLFRFDLGGFAATEPQQRERYARVRSAVTEVELANVDTNW